MPRDTSHRLTCGAIGVWPWRPAPRRASPSRTGRQPGLEVGPGAAPAAESGIERRLLLTVRRMVVAAGGVGLPQPPPVRPSHKLDPMPSNTRPSMRMRSPRVCGPAIRTWPNGCLEDVEAGLVRDQADVHVGSGGLRRGLRRRSGSARSAIDQFPCSLFSNTVERLPRSTMSKRYARLSSGTACVQVQPAPPAAVDRRRVRDGVEDGWSCGISGSPSKYIWVIRRCAKPLAGHARSGCAPAARS